MKIPTVMAKNKKTGELQRVNAEGLDESQWELLKASKEAAPATPKKAPKAKTKAR